MNMIKAIIYQCVEHGFYNAFFGLGNGRGIFSPRSHYCKNGEPKVTYGHKETAEKAAARMNAKYEKTTLIAYKCGYCDGFHIGNVRRQPKK